MGAKFSDANTQSDIKSWPFKVEAGENDKPIIVVQHQGKEKKFMPEQISAIVLGQMKSIAEGFTDKSIKNAVITVPAYFNDAQR